ncbi:DUF2232 domain-containing protein [Aminipila luticellarii]|uniref:DUF2232 domain-containing protein n=1 Tax=Aminipila luticellarii TaxID=2507160 RepID=A0A410PS61_9FIRM|nr:DUF2232 domain-containing protein [Aminipila luticellarii]QAT41764.1 DUF2232 domain-containing protein [Aminipila luticellarii]
MYILIIFSVLVFLPLPLMASAARKTKNGFYAVFESILGVATAMMLMFIIASVTGNPVGQAISSDLQSFCEAAAQNDQFVTMLGMENISMNERISTLTKVYTYAINALPATILVWSTIIAYFEYIIISKISSKSKYPFPELAKLKDFTMPKKALWGWILIYVMTFLVSVFGFKHSDVLQINIQVLFQFAFQIQGIAVIFYFCDLRKWPRAVAVVFCLLFFPTAIGQMLLCLIGFFDLGFGLRKIITRR